MKKKKKDLTTILLVVVLIAGLSLLLYPPVSNYWNSLRQTTAITHYDESISKLDTEQYETLWNAAQAYNQALLERDNPYMLTETLKAEYEQVLDLSGIGVMGYIEIPEIDVSLPIYHGTEESVLQVAVGHIEWSSLPVGGAGSHCVLSGHRGLPSAKLFTNLDKLQVGDMFMLRVLNEVLTYEVDQILIVEPHESGDLQMIDGEDFCTLVTCTPYGINTHRLLVRGHRVENKEEAKLVRVTADAMQIEPLLAAPFAAIPFLLVLLIILMIPQKKRKGENNETFKNDSL